LVASFQPTRKRKRRRTVTKVLCPSSTSRATPGKEEEEDRNEGPTSVLYVFKRR
jgi:hypothetical protein